MCSFYPKNNFAGSSKLSLVQFRSSHKRTSCSQRGEISCKVCLQSFPPVITNNFTECTSIPSHFLLCLCCRLWVPANALTLQPAFLPSIERRGLTPPDRVLCLTNLYPAQSEEEKKKRLSMLPGDDVTRKRTAFTRTESVSFLSVEVTERVDHPLGMKLVLKRLRKSAQ